jgi:hypothetical protein
MKIYFFNNNNSIKITDVLYIVSCNMLYERHEFYTKRCKCFSNKQRFESEKLFIILKITRCSQIKIDEYSTIHILIAINYIEYKTRIVRVGV